MDSLIRATRGRAKRGVEKRQGGDKKAKKNGRVEELNERDSARARYIYRDIGS